MDPLAWNAGDVDILGRSRAPRVRPHQPTRPRGSLSQKKYVTYFFFPRPRVSLPSPDPRIWSRRGWD